jgi:CubicO group peptidase (beta-lactamase class C family)
MKRILYFLTLVLCLQSAAAQELYYPPNNSAEWETISPEALGWCEDFIPPLLQYLDERNTKAFLLLKDGRIVIEAYFDNFTAENNWYWASAGKTMTAFTVGMAQQEGLLDITDKTSDYLGTGWTSCTAAEEEEITVFHQLSMTTGLDDEVDDQNCLDSDCLECLEAPGNRWAYYNAPYTLLTYVVEAASNQNINVFINSRIKQPTGMDGLYILAGGNRIFWSTPRSMARFGLLMLGGGNWNGTPVMTDTDFYTEMITPSNNLNESYGYLWWLNGQSSFMVPGVQFSFPGPLFTHAPADMYSGLGFNAQLLNVVPSKGIVMIRMGENPQLDAPDFMLNDSIWSYLNLIICTETSSNAVNLKPSRSIVPNPVHDFIQLDPFPENAEFEIFNAAGQQIFSGRDLKNFSVNQLPSGLYFLHIKMDGGHEVHRFVK